jgi:Rod binding domain-containing protein
MSSLNPSTSTLDTSRIVFPTELHIKTPEQKQVYASAQEFERYFVQQMLKPMQDAGKMLGGGDDSSGGSDEASGDAGMSGYSDMAQDQMTQAVLDGGGLGIASSMYTQMAQAAGISTDDGSSTAAAATKDAAGSAAATTAASTGEAAA